MQTLLPRSEIVRLVRGLLGLQTDNGLSAAVSEQHITAVRMAASKVAIDCRWVTAQARVTVPLGIEQEAVDYPVGCTAGSLMGVAVFDGNRYHALESRIIPVQIDTDQQLAAGGAAIKAVLGRPRFYQQRAQIHLFPRADKAYPIRLEFMRDMTLPTDNTVSIVDAELITYWAASMVSKQMGDSDGAQYYAQMYKDRLGSLRAWQSSGTRFAIDREADLGEEESVSFENRPNWNRLPTPYPPVP